MTNAYPFQQREQGAPTRVAKTTGKTGIMRTRERLDWQKKHLEQTKLRAQMSLKAANARVAEEKQHDAMVKDITQKINMLMTKLANARRKTDAVAVRKLQSNISSLQENVKRRKANAARLRKDKQVFLKRAQKYGREVAKLQDHMRRNAGKLNKKIATRAAKRV